MRATSWVAGVGVGVAACRGTLGGKPVTPDSDVGRAPAAAVRVPILPDSLRRPDAGAIVGVVVDEQTNHGVANAEVDVLPPTGHGDDVAVAVTRSGADGGFVIPRIPPGRYAIGVRRPGYALGHTILTSVAAAAVDTVIVRLPRAS